MTREPSKPRWRSSFAATAGLIVVLTTATAWAQRGSAGSAPWPQAAKGQDGDGIRIDLSPSTRTPYAGEVVNVEALITASGGTGGQIVGTPQWREVEGNSTATAGWSAAERITVNGTPAVRFRSRATVTTPGASLLPGVTQEVRVRAEGNRISDVFKDRFFSGGFGSGILDDFFAEVTTRTVTAAGAPVALDVRPLPQPSPPGFSGAVGHFSLDSQLTPTTVRAGDPVTWTLTLRGTGNWPAGIDLPARALPPGTRSLKPKTRRDFGAAERFDGSVSEDLVLIPGEAGSMRLDAVRFVYFDPDKGEYVTLQAAAPAIDVQPAGVPVQAQTVPVPAAASAAAPAAADTHAIRLLRAPVEGSGRGMAPVSTSVLLTLLALPFLLLAAFALRLGSERARAHDPLRPRRVAAARLAPVIAAVRSAATPQARAWALLDWQQTAARALGLPTLAPTSTTLRTLNLPVPAGACHEWAALWSQSEQAVHAPDGVLPTDWCDRAQSAARNTGIPRFNVLRALMPQHLFATAASAALVLVLLGAGPAAAGPLADYQSGSFAAARDTWRQRAVAEPTDWIARYNLGLAEAQLGNSGRALAETTAAFLLEPRNQAARWNLDTFIERVPTADARLVAFARGSGATRLARQLSPSGWQLTLLIGALLLAGASGLGLYRNHRGFPHRPAHMAAAMLPGLTLFTTAALAIHLYGPLADPNAAIISAPTVLRSVPTAVAQVEKPIGAGGIVNVDRYFLDWARVTQADGEMGWLRSADLVPLYAAQPSASLGSSSTVGENQTAPPG